VRALARREGTNESALVRQLLEAALQASPVEATPAPHQSENARGGMRLSIGFGPSMSGLLEQRARGRGMAPATYVSCLVRAHVMDAAPLHGAEYLTVKHAVAVLTATERHLDRIARAPNPGAGSHSPSCADLRAVLKVAGTLREDIKALVSASNRAWRVGCGQKAR